MNIIAQEARKKQEVVKQAIKHGKSATSRKYGVSLSTLKRWCKKYDGTWQFMLEKSHRPHSHPKRHTPKEERQIKNSFKKEIRSLRLERSIRGSVAKRLYAKLFGYDICRQETGG